MSDDTYNGWKNRETWAAALHLSNDEGLYDLTRERVADAHQAVDDYYTYNEATPEQIANAKRHRAGEAVKDMFEELTDPSNEMMRPEDIHNILTDVGSTWRVEWADVAESFEPEDDDEE